MLNLTKGVRIDLTKDNQGLDMVKFAGGWNPNKERGGKDFDLDLFAVVLHQNRAVNAPGDILYFGSPKNNNFPEILNGALTHSGDELTGGKEGDDEVITCTLSKLPADASHVIFCENIYQAVERNNQNFGMVDAAFIRIDNGTTNEPIAKLDLTEDFSAFNGVVVGFLYRTTDGHWKWNTAAMGVTGNIEEIALKLTETLNIHATA